MTDTKAPPAPDHPWREATASRKPVAIVRAYATWNDDDYDRMELEALVEKRS